MHPEYQILWAGPAILLAAIVIGWGAETAQLYISQGLALAVLAWLQTLPEFAVEAVIAWEQKQDLMIANLTGSLRLLVGFGWPSVYLAMAIGMRRKKIKFKWPTIKLPAQNGLDVFIMLVSALYFLVIYYKATLTVIDAAVLFTIYGFYLYQLSRLPTAVHEEEEDLPAIAHYIHKMKKPARVISIIAIFVFGGLLLNFCAHPFLNGLEAVAVMFGFTSFFFIQWVAPFVSEFPEKVTAFQWALTVKKAPLAIMNMASSNIVQWTMMSGMIAVIYSFSRGEISTIHFDKQQEIEILLTIVQALLAVLFMLDLEFSAVDAIGLFALWFIQFVFPHSREEILFAYGAWMVLILIGLIRRGKLFYAFSEFRAELRRSRSKKK